MRPVAGSKLTDPCRGAYPGATANEAGSIFTPSKVSTVPYTLIVPGWRVVVTAPPSWAIRSPPLVGATPPLNVAVATFEVAPRLSLTVNEKDSGRMSDGTWPGGRPAGRR